MATELTRIGLLATGNELAEGDILNTNGQAIAQTLINQHLPVGSHVISSDVDYDIEEALRFLLQSHSHIIITGGLGPTSDDRTRYALSNVIGKELILDDATWQYIGERLTQRGFAIHPANRQQALFPQGAQILPNKNGTAAGCRVQHNDKIIYMLPGPPLECLTIFEEFVLPGLIATQTSSKKIKLSWRVSGVIESEIAAQVDAAMQPYPVVTGYRMVKPYLDVKIYCEQHAKFDEMLDVINKLLEPYLVTTDK
jgi:nicotinamide-nucleotide amidase